MLELLSYLRANGFKTFIVSGGGVEFMRRDREGVRHSAEQVIGSSIKTKFRMRDGSPTLFRLPDINFIDDKTGKPVGINEALAVARLPRSEIPTAISRCCSGRPSAAAYASVRSFITPMRARICLRQKVALRPSRCSVDAAAVNRWTVIDMKKDWKVIFPFEKH